VSILARPTYDPSARVVARRELRLGERTYVAGEELSAEDRAEVSDRLLAMWWQQGLVDTVQRTAEISDADLERLTAPTARPQPKPAAARR
jgi:hypothetical protein